MKSYNETSNLDVVKNMQLAITNSNLGNKLLVSATTANKYHKESVENVAICAADVQIANNAIVKLASDIGSIFSIVNGADRESDIFEEIDKSRTLVDNAAYAAENALRLAMEASMYTSEVSVSSVLDKTKTANLAVNSVLDITSTDINNISETVTISPLIVQQNFHAEVLGGLSAQKKLELDTLATQVIDEQHNVDQFQAIVNSLTENTTNIQNVLNIDQANKTYTHNNKVLIEQLATIATELKDDSSIATKEMSEANSRTKELVSTMKPLSDKLINATALIIKYSNTITKKKALNPLISDDLISMLGKAVKDANNAVALTKVAIQSTLAGQASNLETEMAVALIDEQSLQFVQLVTGKTGDLDKGKSLAALFTQAYENARAKYEETEKALKVVTKQLNEANTNLNMAEVKLRSLQSGLAAANAASLAS